MSILEHRAAVVIGLGSMGSMALWQLANRGIDVLGIEQYGRLHTFGAYAGESRLFRVAAKEGEIFTPALLRSRELWAKLGAEYGQQALLPVGALSIGPAGHPDLAATLASIERYGLPHELLDANDLRSRFPQFSIETDDIGILDPLGGAMRPELAVAAATQLAFSHGADARYDTRVVGIEPGPHGVLISTSDGQILADRLVVTAGPWTTRLLPELADLIRVVSYSLIWFLPRHIEMFTPDRFPGFLRDLHGVHAFGLPSLDGYSIKATPTIDLPDAADWDDRETTLTREQLRWAGEQMQRMIPDLIPEPSRWSVHGEGFIDGKMPIIDTLADGAIVVAAGMSGNGFKFAPVWGETLADLITAGSAHYADDVFTVASHRRSA